MAHACTWSIYPIKHYRAILNNKIHAYSFYIHIAQNKHKNVAFSSQWNINLLIITVQEYSFLNYVLLCYEGGLLSTGLATLAASLRSCSSSLSCWTALVNSSFCFCCCSFTALCCKINKRKKVLLSWTLIYKFSLNCITCLYINIL